jgi:hypothetical protein
MKKVLVVMMLGLFIGGAFIPGSTSIVPKESYYTDGWVYDEDNTTWYIEFSGQINASFVETYVVLEKSSVGVIFSHEYNFSNGSRGYIETSYNHGDTWTVMKVFNANSSSVRDVFIAIVIDSLWVRFTVESIGGNGYWRVWDIDLIGDTRGGPPESWLTLEGNEVIWRPYHKARITAYDDKSGVKEIHYILYGRETVVSDDRVELRVDKEGIHYLIYWAVDNLGNEEIPHIVPPLHVDNNPPTIEIITPDPGLYLFGRKITIPTDNIIFIGGFTIEVTAHDTASGVYEIIFFLDDNVYAEVAKKPYRAYCSLKHNGHGTIKVNVIDYAGFFSEDTLDIMYYKFR